jgi:lysyl-tRNA synthetase class 1
MSIKYLCIETGKEDNVNLRIDHIAKLNWKIDWPMRWQYEKVHFEPGGSDHAAPGGSYDVSSVIAKEIFDHTPPVFVEYMFVGIQGLGSKMSGSKGNAVSPSDLLDIYEPSLLKWLYLRKAPNQSFELAFNTEVYRQYDEYDADRTEIKAIPFRQLVGLGQIVQWQENKLFAIVEELGLDYNKKTISLRLPLARNWLAKYNPTELIALNNNTNNTYVETLTQEQKARVKLLRDELTSKKHTSIADLEFLVYQIPKKSNLTETELKKEQRAFFKDIYNLLIGKDTGPRLGTFLWAVDRTQIIKLLNI